MPEQYRDGLVEASTAQDEQQLSELLGLAVDSEPLRFWKSIALPTPPAGIKTNVAICDARGWLRHTRAIDAGLLIGHFRGDYALGGIHSGASRVLVVDLDNRVGKGHRGTGVDVDMPERMRLAEALLPDGVWIRSSASHGLHRWGVLEDPVRLDQLSDWALGRLRDVVEQSSEDVREQLEDCGPGGVPGYLELLPYQTTSNGQGATIRAPFGRGSALLDGAAIVTHPGEVLRRFHARFTRQGPAKLVRVFPDAVTTQLGFSAAVRTHTPTRPTRPPRRPRAAPAARDLRPRILRWSSPGRKPGCLRGKDLTELFETVDELRVTAPPWGTRHRSSFLLSLGSKLRGLSQTQTQRRMDRWLRDVAIRTSREARQNLEATARKTQQIAAHTYREGTATGTRRRYRTPEPIRKGDQLALEARLGADGYLLKLGIRILCFAKANLYVDERTGLKLSPLPVHALNIRDARARRARAVIERAGIISLVTKAVPYYDEHHPKGPQAARPALWAIVWRYSNHGARVRERRPISAAERAQILSAQRLKDDLSHTRRGVRGGFAGDEAAESSKRGELRAEDGSVGAVENPSGFPRDCGRKPTFESSKPSIGPAASIGLFNEFRRKSRYSLWGRGRGGGGIRHRPPRQLRLPIRWSRRVRQRLTNASPDDDSG